ncbi:MAG TPA: SRPBCC family protein [Candidatus Limnocylindrales bacterium]|nr:SRPBCC family protein [Candidatus Limnocylindrales bacterium]
MRFERSIEIEAIQQRVWDVVSDVEAWPTRVDTVERIELLTPVPLGLGGKVRLRQPKLREGEWQVTTWDPPAFFEWVQKPGGMTIIAGHRVDAIADGRARLTLTIEMRGPLAPIFGRMYGGLTKDYLARECEGMKRAAEAG